MSEINKRKNYKNQYHFKSLHWQEYRKALPSITEQQFEIAVGMILGDASIYKTSFDSHIKFEQGYKQQAFIEHLFAIFKKYCFAEQLHQRFVKNSSGCKILKSFEFKTLSHPSFTLIYNLFYEPSSEKVRKKRISNNLSYLKTFNSSGVSLLDYV